MRADTHHRRVREVAGVGLTAPERIASDRRPGDRTARRPWSCRRAPSTAATPAPRTACLATGGHPQRPVGPHPERREVQLSLRTAAGRATARRVRGVAGVAEVPGGVRQPQPARWSTNGIAPPGPETRPPLASSGLVADPGARAGGGGTARVPGRVGVVGVGATGVEEVVGLRGSGSSRGSRSAGSPTRPGWSAAAWPARSTRWPSPDSRVMNSRLGDPGFCSRFQSR